MESSLRIARIRGIDIGIHFSWLFIFFLITWSLATGFFPELFPGMDPTMNWVLAVISALLLFVAVLLHELSHAFVALSRGIPVQSITLFLFGGVANMKTDVETAKDEFLIAIVGPITSLAIGGLCWVALQVVGVANVPVAAVLYYLAYVNVLLAVFNMVPGFPLDGGRVLRSIVWAVTDNVLKATRVASIVGRIIAYLFIFGGLYLAFTGVFLSGIWLIFIGWFLNTAAEGAYQQVLQKQLLEGVRVGEVMEPEPIGVPPSLSVSTLVDDYILRRGLRALPVIEGDRTIGIITLTDIKEQPRERWDTLTVGEVMGGRDGVRMVSPRDSLARAMSLLVDQDLNQVPVMDNGRLVGMLSRGRLLRNLQLRQELGQGSR
ncbi:MAG TPA: site-2 protease family protein [Chloroflexota bacterium]|nr:site-2 protease family protein [Chloroflexota bacterium]